MKTHTLHTDMYTLADLFYLMTAFPYRDSHVNAMTFMTYSHLVAK